jgi:hypothetical protein
MVAHGSQADAGRTKVERGAISARHRERCSARRGLRQHVGRRPLLPLLRVALPAALFVGRLSLLRRALRPSGEHRRDSLGPRGYHQIRPAAAAFILPDRRGAAVAGAAQRAALSRDSGPPAQLGLRASTGGHHPQSSDSVGGRKGVRYGSRPWENASEDNFWGMNALFLAHNGEYRARAIQAGPLPAIIFYSFF